MEEIFSFHIDSNWNNFLIYQIYTKTSLSKMKNTPNETKDY